MMEKSKDEARRVERTIEHMENEVQWLKKQLAEGGVPSLSRVERLVARLEAMKIGDYLDVLQKPSKIIWTNFLAGIFRGLGMAIGASMVFALILDFLKEILLLNIPGIGDFIAQIINLVEKKTNIR